MTVDGPLAGARRFGEWRRLLQLGLALPLPMVLAAGLRGRIRMAADQLTVRIPVRELKPLSV